MRHHRNGAPHGIILVSNLAATQTTLIPIKCVNNNIGGGDAGAAACRAIGALCELTAIDQMLNTFIRVFHSPYPIKPHL
jgi:hypothetical protein